MGQPCGSDKLPLLREREKTKAAPNTNTTSNAIGLTHSQIAEYWSETSVHLRKPKQSFHLVILFSEGHGGENCGSLQLLKLQVPVSNRADRPYESRLGASPPAVTRAGFEPASPA